MSYCHTNASGVRRPLILENKYSNIFFYKTSRLKFHMEHDLTPGSQNSKILGQVVYPRWPLFLKIAKTAESTSSLEQLDIFG